MSHPAKTDGHVLHGARFYDWMFSVFSLGRERTLRAKTVELAALEPRQRALEVGCGTGSLIIEAARTVPSLQARGIDPAPEMIARARRKASAAGVSVDLDVAVVEDLPVESASIDAVFSSLMLHHLPPETRSKGLEEVLRVLVPGGRLVVIEFAGRGPFFHRLRRLFGHRHGADHGHHGHHHGDDFQAVLLDAVRDAGFQVARVEAMRPSYLFALVALKPE